MPTPTRLLALDLDGTLLRRDGSIDPRDEAAIERARARGVIVTIATGRVAGGAFPTAESLRLEHPLVCADGGLIVCPVTKDKLEERGLGRDIVLDVVGVLGAQGLAPFIVTHESIHTDARGEQHHDFVSIWTRGVMVHDELSGTDAWQRDGLVAITVGVGTHEAVSRACALFAAKHAGVLDVLAFQVSRGAPRWALLVRPHGCTKGEGLARLATRLGIARENVAAVGDWYNDVSMFAWAGRSFAMGGAPAVVREAATDGLDAKAGDGGGVAEALARWLGDDGVAGTSASVHPDAMQLDGADA